MRFIYVGIFLWAISLQSSTQSRIIEHDDVNRTADTVTEEVSANSRRRAFKPLFLGTVGSFFSGGGGGGAATRPAGKGAAAADTANTTIDATTNIMSSVFDALSPMNVIKPWMKVASTTATGAGNITDKVLTNHVKPNTPGMASPPETEEKDASYSDEDEYYNDEGEYYDDEDQYPPEDPINHPRYPTNAPATPTQPSVNGGTPSKQLSTGDANYASPKSPDSTSSSSKPSEMNIIVIVSSICFVVLLVAIIVGFIIARQKQSSSVQRTSFEYMPQSGGPHTTDSTIEAPVPSSMNNTMGNYGMYQAPIPSSEL